MLMPSSMGAIAGIAMPLIQTGIQAAAGAIGKGGGDKKPEAKAPEGGAEGGAAPAGGAAGAAGANGAAGAQQQQVDQIDRFIQMLNSPNIRSIGDIKNFRDQVLGKMQGLPPDQQDSAKKKLNQAIIQKLGIGQPGANGSLTVPLTPQNQQILQALGMQPDQVTPAGGQPAAQPGLPGAAPQVGAPLGAAAGPQPGVAAPVPGMPGMLGQ